MRLACTPRACEGSCPLARTPPSPRWHEAPLLPGVARLVAHLQAVGVRMALATSTSRATLGRKLASKAEMREAFAEVGPSLVGTRIPPSLPISPLLQSGRRCVWAQREAATQAGWFAFLQGRLHLP